MRKMNILMIFIGVIVIFCSVLLGHKYFDNMPYNELLEIIKEDAVVFSEDQMPRELLEELAGNKVVIVGEYHNIREHTTFLVQLSTALNRDYSFTKLLVETPQAYSWVFEDYSTGVLPEVDEKSKQAFWFYVADLEKIRDYNSELAEDKKLSVHTIDINHSPFSFITSLEFMQKFVGDSEVLEDLTSYLRKNINDNKKYIDKLNDLQDKLEKDKALYISKLGDKWYNRLRKMIEVELYSNKCRNYLTAGKTDQRYKEREEMIKGLVDEQLAAVKGGVVLNVGAYHGQKYPFNGTKHEWIGEYLSYHSPYAKDKTYSLLVAPMRGSIEGKNKVDVSDTLLKNELFSVIARYAGNNRAFLSYTDERLSKEKVLVNFHYQRKALIPKKQYDGVLLLPKSTYVNPFPLQM